MRVSSWITLGLAFLLVVFLSGDLLACPNCKEAVASQVGDGTRLQEGYSYSIMLMLSMPALLLGGGAFFVARAVKRGWLPEM